MIIDDLDRSVETLLRQELPAELMQQVTLSFATPDEQFPPTTVSLPAIDLFLYDLRENRDLRSAEWVVDRPANGGPVTRQPPPARVDCSYLITAWSSESSTTRPLDEHRLLGEVMAVLLRYPTLPAWACQGVLQGQAPPLPTIALQSGPLQSMAEFWQALGGRPRAALSYTVTIGVAAQPPVEAGPLVRESVVRLREGT